MKRFLGLAIISLFVASCHKDTEIATSSEGLSNNQPAQNEYAISEEEALSNLEEFMHEFDASGTRSVGPRIVQSITPIKYNSFVTRNNTSVDCENLLYVANFDNNQGYAILAGDSRISDPVIAVVDNGSLSDATVYSAIELMNMERRIFDGYPTTGPGFYTTPETGNEIFMNPNTVTLYDETVGDTLVGNFLLDDIGSETDEIIITPLQSPANNSYDSGILTSSLCVSYAMNEISNVESLRNDIIGGDYGGGGGSTPRQWTKDVYTSWTTVESVSPMLTQFTGWHQRSPFNDLYPERRKGLLFGTKRKALAGCFPLAIAKILTHFEYPGSFTYNGYRIDWDALKEDFNSPTGSKSAAYLLHCISSGCNSWYFYQGTFTFPSKATDFMESVGLYGSHSHKYDYQLVKDMLDAGRPLIIYSVPGIDITSSHSWNIDGYYVKERQKTTETYLGSELIKTSDPITETCKMVHCDFGWEGGSNGYYVSGVFKLNDSRIEFDAGSETDDDTNYNNMLKVITYNIPQ